MSYFVPLSHGGIHFRQGLDIWSPAGCHELITLIRASRIHEMGDVMPAVLLSIVSLYEYEGHYVREFSYSMNMWQWPAELEKQWKLNISRGIKYGRFFFADSNSKTLKYHPTLYTYYE
jgi:hypothetical protein